MDSAFEGAGWGHWFVRGMTRGAARLERSFRGTLLERNAQDAGVGRALGDRAGGSAWGLEVIGRSSCALRGQLWPKNRKPRFALS